jgi:putative inorganic carbon (HCO3(-)) transporter
MNNHRITNQRAGLFSPLLRVLEDTFLEKKLNNWIGLLLVAAMSCGLGYLLARHFPQGIMVVALSIGISVLLVAMLSTEAGFYIIVSYSFFAYLISRYFFNDTLAVAVLTDILIIATLFSFFVKRLPLRATLGQFTRSPVVVWTLIVYCYVTIDFFNPYGHSVEISTLTFRKNLETLLLLFIAYALFDSREAIRKYLKALFILCVIVGFYGCFQQWHGLMAYEKAWAMADETRFGLLFINGDFRKFSSFNDPTAYGIVMAAASVFFIIIAIHEKNKKTRRILFGGIVIMLLGMAYSGTRTANIMVAGGILMFILLSFDRKTTRVFTFVAAIIFAGLMNVPVYNNPTLNRFRSSFVGSEDESYKVRQISRKLIQPYIYAHPIGGGLGTTGIHGALFNPGHYLAGFQTDSGYLKKALETGWIGLAIICILYFTFLREGIRGYFRCRDPQIKVVYAAATGSILTFYIAEFAQDAIGQITDLVVYYPMMAIIMKLKYFDKPVEPRTV